MSRTIDSRVVEMQFDNKQFESNVKTSMSTLDKLKQSLNLTGASKGLENIGTAAKNVNMSGLSGAVENVRLKFSALEVMAVTALANITNSAINAGKRIVSALTIEPISEGFGEYELKMGSIQTIMAGTGASLEQVNAKLEELNIYADKTIYSFGDMTSNIGKFTNAGVSLEESVAAIKGVANAAALSGSNANEASRAMYNFAQALSAGYVKLIDWKSIENANMATVEFKTQLLESAVAAGTLSKTTDGMYKTLKGTVISATLGFNDSLQEQWMTTEALVKTLNNYADETTDIGKRATAAATEVKTFTQLFNTLKEAAGSGWAQTWELVIGDFEEAKETLTYLNDIIGGFIDRMSDARNELLSGALSSGWKQLMKLGISDSEDFKQTISEVAKEHGISVDEMVKDAGSFEKSLKNGWLTSDILSESIEKLTEKFDGLSEEEIAQMGYTLENVEALKKLNSEVKDGSVSMKEFEEKIKSLSGREMIFESLFNIAKGIGSVLKPIGEAFRDIFPPTTSDQLHSFIVGLHKFSEKLKISDGTADKIKRTFAGLFAVLDLVKDAFGFVFNVAGQVFSLFGGPTAGGILELTARFGDFLVKLRDTAKEGDIFGRAFEKIQTIFTTVADKIKDAISRIGTAFQGFKSIDTGPLDKFSEKAEKRLRPFTRLGQIFGAAFEAIVKVLEWAAPNVAKLGSIIGKGLGTLADKVSYAVENMEFNEILDLINTGLFGAILLGIKKFINSLTDITSEAGGFLDGITGILDGVRGSLEAFQSSLKAKTLLTIATAIGILAAALVVISLIDSEKLSTSLTAITVLFVELALVMKSIQKSFGGTKMAKISTQMIAMATAILILSFSMKNLASLDWEGVAKGTVGIAALAAVLVIAANSLDKSSGKLIKGSTGLIAFAAAILIMSKAVESMSALSWEELAKGLTGLTIILAEVVAITHLMGDSKRMISTGIGMIALGAAMLIFASAVEKMGQLSWEEITRGLITMAGALTTITVAINLIPKGMINKATGMVVMGAALLIIAEAMSKFGDMQWGEIARGLVAMAGALTAITLALNLMPKGIITKALGLIGIATALQIMIGPLKQMAGMSWEEIAKGLVTLGGSLLIITVAMNAMTGGLAGAAAMLVMAAAIRVLTPALVGLGQMDLAEIGKALLALVGVFAVVGVAGSLLAPLTPVILGLAAAIALLGVGVVAIGAGLLMFSAGLTALAVSGTAGAAALVVIVTSLISLIPIFFEKIGEGLITLGNVIINGAPIIKDAFLVLLASALESITEAIPMIIEAVFTLLNSLLDALVKYTPDIVEKIFDFLIILLDAITKKLPELIQAGVDVLMAFFSGVIDALSGIDVEVLLKGIVGIGLLSAIMVALAAVAALIPGAMIGVLGMGVVIAELALVLAAIGALAQIPGLKWLINEGAELMQGIGNAIGSFIGSIVGGFMSGVSSNFPKIGTDLSAFMTNIQPFIEGARKIDASTMDGVKALAEVILILTAANILDGLTSWFTGGNSLSGFADELVPFGRAMKAFSDEVSGIEAETVSNAAIAGKTLAEMAATLPNTGGVLGFFAGENDMEAFGEQLVPFGRAIKAFADEVTGLNASVITEAATAGKALAEMADTVPNSGGVVGFFAGENDIEAFGKQLIPFGKAMKDFSFAVTGLRADVIQNSVTAGQALMELAKTVPNTGGVVSWFTGDNDLVTFGEQLVPFGKAMKDYSKAVTGLNGDVVVNSANAAKALVELSNNLPNSGGIVSWFTGDNDLASFGEKLISFGQSFASYYSSISTVNTAQLSGVVKEFKNLVDLANGIKNVDTSGMATFSKNLTSLGNAGIDGFINAFTKANSRVTTAASTMLTTFINAANSKKTELITTFTNLIQAVMTTINSKKSLFFTAGSTLMIQFVDGVKSQDSNSRTTFINIINGYLTAIKNKYYEFQSTGQALMDQFIAGILAKAPTIPNTFMQNISGALTDIKNKHNDFYNVGKNLVEGFADGITANTYLAEARARAMAAAATRAAEKELDINSPSKVSYGIGSFFGKGFVNALIDWRSKSYQAGSEIAKSAKNGLGNAISKITDVIEGDIDTQPTIRPVLDLSDVETGTGRLNALFSRTQAMSISAGMNRTAEEIQNGGNVSGSGNVYSFTQNNYSPKALSRLEIYRQTKNQFSAMKGLVEA